MKRVFVLTVLVVAFFVVSQAQTADYLQEIAKVVKDLRKSNNSVRQQAVATLAANQNPKVTLMDEIKWAGDEEEKANEVKGNQGYRFKLNQVILNVYKKQNHRLESKTNMLNGNEKDIHYSIIERSVKRGGKITYQIKGRMGVQDFMFVPFNPKSKYVVTMYVDGVRVERKESSDVCQIHLNRMSGKQSIVFSINYLDDKSNKDLFESFAILNYNQQK